MLLWGLVQARREYISQVEVKPVFYYIDTPHPKR